MISYLGNANIWCLQGRRKGSWSAELPPQNFCLSSRCQQWTIKKLGSIIPGCWWSRSVVGDDTDGWPERNTYPDISLFAASYQSQLKMEAVPSTRNKILTLPNKIALWAKYRQIWSVFSTDAPPPPPWVFALNNNLKKQCSHPLKKLALDFHG